MTTKFDGNPSAWKRKAAKRGVEESLRVFTEGERKREPLVPALEGAGLPAWGTRDTAWAKKATRLKG